MKYLPALIIGCMLFCCGSAVAQKKTSLPKGKLFIMGGGDRVPSLMNSLLATASMSPKDYVVVLPMSSEYPDTAYYYFKADLEVSATMQLSTSILQRKMQVIKAGWIRWQMRN